VGWTNPGPVCAVGGGGEAAGVSGEGEWHAYSGEMVQKRSSFRIKAVDNLLLLVQLEGLKDDFATGVEPQKGAWNEVGPRGLSSKAGDGSVPAHHDKDVWGGRQGNTSTTTLIRFVPVVCVWAAAGASCGGPWDEQDGGAD
jgi:hypothetical protein